MLLPLVCILVLTRQVANTVIFYFPSSPIPELLVDKAMELKFVGGVYAGNIKPTPFLCLILKMLQIQPEKDIIVEFIKNEEFKYVRALGAFYLRLTGTGVDCYKYLEPLYNDNRKLRRQNRSSQFEIVHMDEFIDELLRSDRVCDIILPRIQKRHILEENNELEPKVSSLEDDLDEDVPSDEETHAEKAKEKASKSNSKSTSNKTIGRGRERSRSPRDRREKHREDRNRDKPMERDRRDRDMHHRDRERERERRDRDNYRERDRDRDGRDNRRRYEDNRWEKSRGRSGGRRY